MSNYAAPSLVDHGTVMTRTLGVSGEVSVDSLLTGGSRIATGTPNDAPHVEDTASVSETAGEAS
jgi:hypothetical protein